MTEVLIYVAAGVVLGVPALLLGLAIRHFIPLMRGWNAPWWAGVLGPFAFADRFVVEPARRHRKKCIAYAVAFVAWCLMLMLFFGATK